MTNEFSKNNSGTRFCALIQAATRFDKASKSLDTWATYFNVESVSTRQDRSHDVAAFLGAGVSELEAMAAALEAQGVPKNLVEPYTSKAATAFALSHLANKWETVVQYFSPDVVLAFKWFAFVLPDEGLELADEQLKELVALVDELKCLLDDEKLPHPLETFIKGHLRAIEIALHTAPLQGAAPLKKAIRETFGDANFEREELIAAVESAENPEKAKSLGQKFEGLWKRVASVCGDADKISKGTKAIGEAYEVVQHLLPW